jgi:hypothetical protein
MSVRLSLVALLLLPWLHGDARHIKATFGDWTLNVQRDAFGARTACKLSSRNVNYQRQSLVIHFAKNIDTTSAAYRIDGGAPIWARWDQMEAARLGFAIESGGLENPSGGLVIIPVARLNGAHLLAVRARPTDQPRLIKIDGLAVALDKAAAMGCAPAAYND